MVQGLVQPFRRIQIMLKEKLNGAFARLTSFAHNPMMTEKDRWRNENFQSPERSLREILSGKEPASIKSMSGRRFSINRFIQTPGMVACMTVNQIFPFRQSARGWAGGWKIATKWPGSHSKAKR